MGEINDLQLSLESRFGAKVEFGSYNVHYDDTGDIEALVEQIWYERIALPATFIDGELCLQGYVDEAAVVAEVENRGLQESPEVQTGYGGTSHSRR